MNFTHKKLIHLFIFTLVVVSVPIFYSCESNNQLVNPFETAKIEIKLVLPEVSEKSNQGYQGKDSNSSMQKGHALIINDVQVSVLDSATQEVIINQQQLTISGNSATGELNIPVTGARQTFTIIVFASDPVQLAFFVGTENIQLESGEVREAPVIIILEAPSLIAPQGAVQASSSFSVDNFAPELAVDFDFSTSWFSAGSSVDGDTSTFTWTGAQEQFIASAGIVNNANHRSIILRNGFGFNTVTFQVFSGPNATGDILFEETVNYPTSTQLPIATVAPFVTGRSIRLLLNEPQDSSRGGFSELLIVGMSLIFYEPPRLQSIAVTPADTSIVTGQTVQFNALGNYSDGSTGNISNQVTWSSTNTNIATISSAGLATANSPGNTIIKAELSGVGGQTGLTVTAASLLSINVTPADTTIVVGDNLQFTATGTFSDNSTSDITGEVTWSSNNTSVASINTVGLATANSAGNATIKAELSGVSGQTGLTVTAASLMSINVTPADTTVVVGDNLQFTASGNFSDNSTSNITNEVTWLSNNTDVASISSVGLATANSAGNTTISAEKDGINGNTNLTVIDLTGATISNFQSELMQVNDSTSCDLFSGPIGSLFDFSVQYNDADGNVSVGTTAQIAWESQPSKVTGSFDINSPTITGDAFTGTINFLTCWIFGGQASFDVTVTITDAVGVTSNALTINMLKPEGANSPQNSIIKGDSRNHLIPDAGVCKEP